MKCFVYWDYGTCNAGDHSCGLDEFEELSEAVRRFERIKLDHYDAIVILISGTAVLRKPEEDT